MAPRPLRNDRVDAVVLEVHGLVHDQGWLADRALERALRREGLWAAERRAAAEAVYGITRWQGQLDWLLFGAGVPTEAREPGPAGRSGRAARASPAPPGARSDRLVLRYAAWLARFGGLGRPEAARRLGVPPGALAPLEGAEARIRAVPDPAERLAVEASLPRWIVERFAAESGLEEAAALARSLNERAPLTVRTNGLRGDRDDLRARLRAEGVAAEPTRLSPWGLVLDGRANAFALAAFREGRFEIQDEGSQLVALACAARPGWLAVDACAGAGGKSLALAAEMRNRGSIWALDADEDRLGEARRRARRAGVHNLRSRTIPAGPEAAEALRDLEGKADLVLVDAPCSGLGTLRRKPDARWRLRPEDPERFARTQRDLAARFGALVRPGGRLVYATCAIGRTENDEVADFVERELPFAPVPVAPLLGEARALAAGASGSRLHLLPHRHGTDGFFVAVFERRR